jgi:hypothetical protein
VKALAAGSPWRRHRRTWPVVLAYAERIIPLIITSRFGAITGLSALALRTLVDAGWPGKFQRAYWPMEAGLSGKSSASCAIRPAMAMEGMEHRPSRTGERGGTSRRGTAIVLEVQHQ